MNSLFYFCIFSFLMITCTKKSETPPDFNERDIQFTHDIYQKEQGYVAIKLIILREFDKKYQIDFGDGDIRTGSFEGKSQIVIVKNYNENGEYPIKMTVLSRDEKKSLSEERNVQVESILKLPEFKVNQRFDDTGYLHLSFECKDPETEITWGLDDERYSSSAREIKVYLPGMFYDRSLVNYVVMKAKKTTSVGEVRVVSIGQIPVEYLGEKDLIVDSLSGTLSGEKINLVGVSRILPHPTGSLYYGSFPGIRIHQSFDALPYSVNPEVKFEVLRSSFEGFLASKENWISQVRKFEIFSDHGSGGLQNLEENVKSKRITVVGVEEVETIPAISSMYSKQIKVRIRIQIEFEEKVPVDLLLVSHIYFC